MKTAEASRFVIRAACIGIGLGTLLSAIAQPAVAEPTTSQDLAPQAGGSDASSSPFSNSSSPYSGIFDLMHRAEVGQIRSNDQFSQDQQQSLGTAAADFRAKQRQILLQSGQQPTGATATPAPAPQ